MHSSDTGNPVPPSGDDIREELFLRHLSIEVANAKPIEDKAARDRIIQALKKYADELGKQDAPGH